MKTLTSLLLALSLTLNLASCGGGDGVCGGGDGVCNYADSPQTPFTSGTQVYDKAPTPTGSQSPEIAMISYNNVVTPGNTFKFQIDINGSAADISEAVLAESGATNHTVLSVSSAEITSNSIAFTVTLSEALTVEEALELEIGVVDYSGNVSEYHHVSTQLSADEQYAITSYSGDSDFDVRGNWTAVMTVTEPNPIVDVGTKISNQITFEQSGNNLVISDSEGSYNVTVSGNNQYVTMTYGGTISFASQGLDLYADFQATVSGEIVGANEIVGESNSVIIKIFGNDADSYSIYSLKSSIVMTRDFRYPMATEISIGVSYDNEISSADDRGWYVFTTEKGGTIHATLTGLSGDLDIILIDSEGNILSGSYTAGTSDEEISYFSDKAGTYYIEIGGFTGEVSPYILKVTFDD